MTGSTGNRRRLRYGDVLVLVLVARRCVRCGRWALKTPIFRVAGAGRLKPTDTRDHRPDDLAGRAAMLPQDDLAVVVALKARCSALPTTICSSWPGSADLLRRPLPPRMPQQTLNSAMC